MGERWGLGAEAPDDAEGLGRYRGSLFLFTGGEKDVLADDTGLGSSLAGVHEGITNSTAAEGKAFSHRAEIQGFTTWNRSITEQGLPYLSADLGCGGLESHPKLDTALYSWV